MPRMPQLRRATGAAHARIELALPLLDPQLTRAHYLRIVRGFYGFHAALEPLCERALGADAAALGLGARAKLPLLRADLAALGDSPADVLALPLCRDLPTVTSRSQAAGVLYVVEGSTLGGRVIGRHLLRALALTPDSGAAFFASYGDRTGEMWLAFGAHVERMVEFDLDAAVVAAIETFETLERWLLTAQAAG